MMPGPRRAGRRSAPSSVLACAKTLKSAEFTSADLNGKWDSRKIGDFVGAVTMQEQGVSRILTINLNDVERELHIK